MVSVQPHADDQIMAATVAGALAALVIADEGEVIT